MGPRLGVNLLAGDPGGWPDDCRRIEAMGFDEISVADHLVDGSKNPMVALAAAAAVTERVTLSTMVLNNGLRHPAELAAEAAMLQSISSGRFTLGIGSGYATSEHDAIGVPLPAVAERLDRLEEAVAVLRALLARRARSRRTGVTTACQSIGCGRHQHTPVPILVGGGSHRLLEIAAARMPTSSASRGSRSAARDHASPTSAPRVSTGAERTYGRWRGIASTPFASRCSCSR